MRLIRNVSGVKEKIESGHLTITNAARTYAVTRAEKAAPEVRRALIKSCKQKTNKECELILRNTFPEAATFQEKFRPLGGGAVELKFILSSELYEKFEHLKNYCSHSNPHRSAVGLFRVLVESEVRRQEKKRGEISDSGESRERATGVETAAVESTAAVAVKKPAVKKMALNELPVNELPVNKAAVNKAAKKPVRKQLPAVARRKIYRDANQRCQATNCTSTFQLQIDHVNPLAFGGSDHPTNLRILCRAHHSDESTRAQLRFC